MTNIKSVLAVVSIPNDRDDDLETIIHYGKQRHAEFHVIGVERNDFGHFEIVPSPDGLAKALIALNDGRSADCLGLVLAQAMNSLKEWDSESKMDAIVALVQTILQDNIDDPHKLMVAIRNEVEAETMLSYYYNDDIVDYVERQLDRPLLDNADDRTIVEEAIRRDIDLTEIAGEQGAKAKYAIHGMFAEEAFALLKKKGEEVGYLKVKEMLEQL